MSGTSDALRVFTIRTAAGDTLEVSCDRMRITSRGDLLAIVGGLDLFEERARCVRALPVGAWTSVSAADVADTPPHPLPPRRAAA